MEKELKRINEFTSTPADFIGGPISPILTMTCIYRQNASESIFNVIARTVERHFSLCLVCANFRKQINKIDFFIKLGNLLHLNLPGVLCVYVELDC